MVQREADQLDTVFRALGDATRRAMLHALAAGPRKITDLATPFDMSFAAASKHVRVLEAAGLVRRSVEGRTHMCRLEAAPLAAAGGWLRVYESILHRHDDAAIEATPQTSKQPRKGMRP